MTGQPCRPARARRSPGLRSWGQTRRERSGSRARRLAGQADLAHHPDRHRPQALVKDVHASVVDRRADLGRPCRAGHDASRRPDRGLGRAVEVPQVAPGAIRLSARSAGRVSPPHSRSRRPAGTPPADSSRRHICGVACIAVAAVRSISDRSRPVASCARRSRRWPRASDAARLACGPRPRGAVPVQDQRVRVDAAHGRDAGESHRPGGAGCGRGHGTHLIDFSGVRAVDPCPDRAVPVQDQVVGMALAPGRQ